MHLLPLPVLATPLGGLVVEVAHPTVLGTGTGRRGRGRLGGNIRMIIGGLGGCLRHGECGSLGGELFPLGRLLLRDLLGHSV